MYLNTLTLFVSYCQKFVLWVLEKIIQGSAGTLEPRHLKILLSCLQTSTTPSERCQILLTLGNAAAFTVNQVCLSCILANWWIFWSPPNHSFIIIILFFKKCSWPFQNLIREFDGIPIIAGFLADPKPEVRVHTLNALNNLCMNIANQENIKVCCHYTAKHIQYLDEHVFF